MSIPNAVLMVRPAAFGYNPETAGSNAFQRQTSAVNGQEDALQEFDALHRALLAAQVKVILVQDSADPVTPDAVFPNNWFSHHPDGSLVLYPMEAPSRRLERLPNISDFLYNAGFPIKRTLDLSGFEEHGFYLEGTGSMVLDYQHKIAYAAKSSRTHSTVLNAFCQELGFRPFFFQAANTNKKAIYHTNVLMALGDTYVLVCLEAFSNEGEKQAFIRCMEESKRELITLSFKQISHFAGNALQLLNQKGQRVLVLSEAAWQALDLKQQEQLQRNNDQLVRADIPTIEALGGGSVRCMIAGLWSRPQAC